MKLPENKYLIAAAIVIFLVILYFYWRYKKAEKISNNKTSRIKNKKAKKPARRQLSNAKKQKEINDEDQESESDEDPTDEDQDTAQRLYNLVHDRMSSGMQSDEFIETVGNDYDNLTYIEIKQLYNDAKNKGQDPSQVVSIDDYVAVLGKRSS